MQKLSYLVLFLVLFATGATANVRYVSDVMYVPMRSGPGNEFRIIHSAIKSGLKMTILDMPKDSDWAQVKTPSGLEGWIRKQYLIAAPTAKIQLNSATAELRSAKTRAAALAQQLADLQKAHAALTNQTKKLESNHNTVSDELKNLKALSADTISLSHRYKDLLAKHDLIQTEFDAVRAENDRLNADKTVNQWLFGAGLIVTGMFLMLILPALKPSKRSSEWRD